MNAVAVECKKTRHHPEWYVFVVIDVWRYRSHESYHRTNVYTKTDIRWTTHNPKGLSSKDTTMAEFCDRAGEEFGEI